MSQQAMEERPGKIRKNNKKENILEGKCVRCDLEEEIREQSCTQRSEEKSQVDPAPATVLLETRRKCLGRLRHQFEAVNLFCPKKYRLY